MGFGQHFANGFQLRHDNFLRGGCKQRARGANFAYPFTARKTRDNFRDNVASFGDRLRLGGYNLARLQLFAVQFGSIGRRVRRRIRAAGNRANQQRLIRAEGGGMLRCLRQGILFLKIRNIADFVVLPVVAVRARAQPLDALVFRTELVGNQFFENRHQWLGIDILRDDFCLLQFLD